MSPTATPSPQQAPTRSHTAFQQLPVVDVSALFSPDIERRRGAAAALDRAARDAGFLYVTGHGIPHADIAELKNCAEAFFAQPEAVKMQHYIGQSSNHSGYVPMGEERFYGATQVDAKEAYDIGFELQDLSRQAPVLGRNQWPALPGFREGVQHYYNKVLNLGAVLFRGFALGLGLAEDTFTRYLSAPPSQLRLIHYFHNPDAPADQPGIGAHTDYEFFTILLPTSPGLQVLNGAGEWIDVPVLADAFVVNIGDMMEIATNGQYVATSHRVSKLSQERYAFPMFCNLDYDTVVAPLPQFCNAEPARYQAVVCGEHLFAQTAQTFEYLKQRRARGELNLPENARQLASFGREPLRR